MKFESADFAAEAALRNPEYLHPLVAQAAIEARKLKAKEAIDPNEFVGVYGVDAVARDIKYVEDMKKLFDKETSVQKQWADVFEAVFYQHAELSNWLGDDAHTIMASEYDDIKNGIDVAVRIENITGSFPYVGMGIDVTFGSTSVAKKMKRLFGEIEKGELGKMRYFMDPDYDDRFKGELSKMPHIVVGVERSHVIELSRQWLNGEKKALAENPIQLVVLQQVMEQLKAFRDFSEKIGKHELAEMYAADMSVFAPVLRDRRKMDIRNYENDQVAKALSQELAARK